MAWFQTVVRYKVFSAMGKNKTKIILQSTYYIPKKKFRSLLLMPCLKIYSCIHANPWNSNTSHTHTPPTLKLSLYFTTWKQDNHMNLSFPNACITMVLEIQETVSALQIRCWCSFAYAFITNWTQHFVI